MTYTPPDYLPGAAVVVGHDQLPGVVERVMQLPNDDWRYVVKLDRGTICSVPSRALALGTITYPYERTP